MRSALDVTSAISLAIVAAFWLFDLRLNSSPSQPTGIYQLADRPPARGDLVFACVPAAERDRAARYLPFAPFHHCSCLSPVLKTVVGLSGDQVAVALDAVYINGTALPSSAPLQTDSAGRPMPSTWRTGHLDTDQIWLAGRSADSYDSRYFGPVTGANIQGIASPIWSSNHD